MSPNLSLRPSAKEILQFLDKEYKISNEQIEIFNLKIEIEKLKNQLGEKSELQQYMECLI